MRLPRWTLEGRAATLRDVAFGVLVLSVATLTQPRSWPEVARILIGTRK